MDKEIKIEETLDLLDKMLSKLDYDKAFINAKADTFLVDELISLHLKSYIGMLMAQKLMVQFNGSSLDEKSQQAILDTIQTSKLVQHALPDLNVKFDSIGQLEINSPALTMLKQSVEKQIDDLMIGLV